MQARLVEARSSLAWVTRGLGWLDARLTQMRLAWSTMADGRSGSTTRLTQAVCLSVRRIERLRIQRPATGEARRRLLDRAMRRTTKKTQRRARLREVVAWFTRMNDATRWRCWWRTTRLRTARVNERRRRMKEIERRHCLTEETQWR